MNFTKEERESYRNLLAPTDRMILLLDDLDAVERERDEQRAAYIRTRDVVEYWIGHHGKPGDPCHCKVCAVALPKALLSDAKQIETLGDELRAVVIPALRQAEKNLDVCRCAPAFQCTLCRVKDALAKLDHSVTHA